MPDQVLLEIQATYHIFDATSQARGVYFFDELQLLVNGIGGRWNGGIGARS